MVSSLTNGCVVFEHGNSTSGVNVKALWDTGATESVISQRIVDVHGLKPTGTRRVNHAQGTTENVLTFLVDIELPNKLIVPNLTVTLGVLQVDVLIGMDIISKGDFAVTHPNGHTKFTFKMPATDDIDYFLKFATERERVLMDQNLKARGLPGIGPSRRRRKK